MCLQSYKLFFRPQTVCDSCDNKIFTHLNYIIIYIIYYIYNNKILSNIFPTKITVTTVTISQQGTRLCLLPKGRKTFPFVRNAFIVQEICQINSLFVSFCGRFSICLTNETGTFPSLNSDFPLTKVPLSPAQTPNFQTAI